MNAKEVADRARALAETGRKHMRALAMQGVSGLSFDKLQELAESLAAPISKAAQSGPTPAMAAALASIRDWIEPIWKAIVKEFPANPAVSEEFAVGAKIPSDPDQLIALARKVAQAAASYPANLLSRGVDMAHIRQLGNIERNLQLAREAMAALSVDPKALAAQARELIAQIEQAAREAFKDQPSQLEELAIPAEGPAPQAAEAPAAPAQPEEAKKRGTKKPKAAPAA